MILSALLFLTAAVLETQDPVPAAEHKPAPVVEEPEPAEDWRVITLGKSRLTFYGFLRLDAIYDSDRPNSIQITQWILSEDLPSPEGDAAGESDFSMSVRLSRLGLDLDGPEIEELGNAKVTGKLEVDFYNLPQGGNLTSNSRSFLRMRHAYGKLDWGAVSFLFGQRDEVFSPLMPTPHNDMVLWGAGNPGDRRPQLRPEVKAGPLTVTGMIGVTGAVDNQNIDGTAPGTDVFFDGESSGIPTFQGRIGVDYGGWAGKKSNVGVSAHWAREELDLPLATGDDTFTSTGIHLDLTSWVIPEVWIRAEIWTGENLDDVRGGNNQGVNTTTGEEIRARGGWAEVNVQALKWWRAVIGVSVDDPKAGDLPGATSRDKNVIYYFANRTRFGPVEIGLDYLNWTTDYVGPGISDGEDHRFNMFFAYHF